jgi:GNAT superfamily N-acetyltransferase
MKYNLSFLQPEEYGELSKLAEEVKLDEKIDFQCYFLSAKDDNKKLLGVAGVNLNKDIPRFEHIIIGKPYQKTRLAVILMKAIEKFLIDEGYKIYSAYINNSKWWMQRYAEKFNFVKWEDRKNGKWYYKKLVF